MNLDKDYLVRLDKEDLVMIKTLDMDRLQSSIINDHGQRDIEQELDYPRQICIVWGILHLDYYCDEKWSEIDEK